MNGCCLCGSETREKCTHSWALVHACNFIVNHPVAAKITARDRWENKSSLSLYTRRERRSLLASDWHIERGQSERRASSAMQEAKGHAKRRRTHKTNFRFSICPKSAYSGVNKLHFMGGELRIFCFSFQSIRVLCIAYVNRVQLALATLNSQFVIYFLFLSQLWQQNFIMLFLYFFILNRSHNTQKS